MATFAPETRSHDFSIASSSTRKLDQDHAESSYTFSSISRALPSHNKIGRAASASASISASSSSLAALNTTRNPNRLAPKPNDNIRRANSNVMHGPRPPPPRKSPTVPKVSPIDMSSTTSLYKARSSPQLSSKALPHVDPGPSTSKSKQETKRLHSHLASASMSSSGVDKPNDSLQVRRKGTASSLTSRTSQSSLQKPSNANSQQSHHSQNSAIGKSQTLPLTSKDTRSGPKSSGNTSDSSFSRRKAATTAHPLDMKRLLSKPAPQSASPHSATCEWDLGRRGSLSERESMPSVQRREQSKGSRDREERRTGSALGSSLPFPSSPSPITSHVKERNSKTDVKSNVTAVSHAHHRRASDATRSNLSEKKDMISPVNSVFALKARRPSTANTDTRPPPGLTPAGAVAHAYKVQEQRRNVMMDDHTTSPSSVLKTKNRRAASASGNYTADEDSDSHAPYYTILGGTTGRTVAIESALGSVWDNFMSEVDVSGHHAGPATSRLKRDVSRKMSGRWRKKDNDGGDRTGAVNDEGLLGEKAKYDIRDKTDNGRAALKLSMDGLGVSNGGISTSKSLSKDKPWSSDKAAVDLDTVWKIEKGYDTYGDRVKSRKKSIVDDNSTAGKLWKLVKKISSGALKDNHRHHLPSDVPPVPSLPEEVLQSLIPRHQPQQQSPSSSIKPDLNAGRRSSSRTSRPRPSLSLRPSTAPSPTRRRPSMPFITPVTTPRQDQSRNVSNSSGAQASTATSSSSPVSSQSHLFNRAHSPQSSSSSYGEEIMPSIHAGLNQERDTSSDAQRSDHFWKSIPPSSSLQPHTMLKLDITSDQSPALFQDIFVNSESPPDSPTIPTFSTEFSVNSFRPRRASADHIPQLPDQVRRSIGVKPSTHSHLNGFSTPRKLSESSDTSDYEDIENINSRSVVFPELSQSTRRSGQQSPMRKSSASQVSDDSPYGTPQRTSAGSLSSANTVTASPMMFRDIKESRQVWSEQEKVDKWDDLLLRSAKAGGTLHVGLEKLLSDEISLSSF